MRCRACNAPLSIENEQCPFCGTPNPHALEHRQDMKRFTGDFLRTRASVLRMTGENAEKSTRIIIVCIMLLATLLSYLFCSNAWDISYYFHRWKAAANSSAYTKQLQAYEADEDYLALAAFYSANSLYNIEAYDEFAYVREAASSYQTIYYYSISLLEEERWENEHRDTLKYLCNSLDDFYELLSREHYSWYTQAGAYRPIHQQSVSRIEEKIEGILRFCFSLSEEDLEDFRTMSAAEKRVLLERRLLSHD